MALHDSLDKVDQAAFRDMCPSLVSQSLFADCAHEDEHSGGDMTDAQSKSCNIIFCHLKVKGFSVSVVHFVRLFDCF